MSQCPCPNSNSSCLLITEFTWVSTTHVEQLRVQRASQHKMESRLMQNHSKHFSRTNLTVEANIHICSLSLPLPSFSSISPSLPDPFSPFHTRQKCTKVHADKLCYFFILDTVSLWCLCFMSYEQSEAASTWYQNTIFFGKRAYLDKTMDWRLWRHLCMFQKVSAYTIHFVHGTQWNTCCEMEANPLFRITTTVYRNWITEKVLEDFVRDLKMHAQAS